MSNKDDANDSLVLTPTETAKILRIGRGTVYEQIRNGTIPSIRMGRKILVPKAALIEMLETAKGKERILQNGGDGTYCGIPTQK